MQEVPDDLFDCGTSTSVGILPRPPLAPQAAIPSEVTDPPSDLDYMRGLPYQMQRIIAKAISQGIPQAYAI